jgi:hypothetical protein
MPCSNLFSITFHGSVHVWYHRPKLDSILDFVDLYAKIIFYFSTSILAKNSILKLFATKAYLQRFYEKMLNVKSLLELIAIKALINGV